MAGVPFATSPLVAGTRLGEFELLSLLGQGAFGVVYLAFDHVLHREVAINEYMPASIAVRSETVQVTPRSQNDAAIYSLGLRCFVDDGRLLSRFSHPSLLKVHRCWEANGTAYWVMPVLRGPSLEEIRDGVRSLGHPIDEAWLRHILRELLGALEQLHAEGDYHGNIAAARIRIEADGRPVLLGFGSAQRKIGERTPSLIASPKPGPTSMAQHAESGSLEQGPWTDLVGLGETIRGLLLGQDPATAAAGAPTVDGAAWANRRIEGFSEDFLCIVNWMRSTGSADRPPSAAAVLEALSDPFEPMPGPPPLIEVSSSRLPPDLAPEVSATRLSDLGRWPPVPPGRAEPSAPRNSGGAIRAILGGALAATMALPVALARVASGALHRIRTRVSSPTASSQQNRQDGYTVSILGGGSDDQDPFADTSFCAAGHAEPLQFGISAPRSCTAGAEFSLLFSAYVASQRVPMQERMQALADPSHRQMLDLPPDEGAVWSVGTPFTVRLSGRHFESDPPQRHFAWNGRHNQVSFSVIVKETAPPSAVLEVSVWVQGLAVAAFAVQMQVDRAAMPGGMRGWLPAVGTPEPRAEALAPRSLFASYASKDATEVAGRLSTLARFAPGLDIFQDCLDLKPNDRFKPQLEAQIKARDAFMLFWSRNAAQSSWVHWEIETALAAKGRLAIMPVPLEDPAIAPPPIEFADDHLRDRFMLAGYALQKIAELARGARELPLP
jgi:serine/threonine protein kinase